MLLTVARAATVAAIAWTAMEHSHSTRLIPFLKSKRRKRVVCDVVECDEKKQKWKSESAKKR